MTCLVGFVVAMRHVQPRHTHSLVGQTEQVLLAVGGGPDGADNLGLAQQAGCALGVNPAGQPAKSAGEDVTTVFSEAALQGPRAVRGYRAQSL